MRYSRVGYQNLYLLYGKAGGLLGLDCYGKLPSEFGETEMQVLEKCSTDKGEEF